MSSSAEEDDWNYNKLQKINGNDHKIFYKQHKWLTRGKPNSLETAAHQSH